MALVECGTLWSSGSSECRTESCRGTAASRKQRVRDDGVDRCRAGRRAAPWRRRSWCRRRRRYRRRSGRDGRQCMPGSSRFDLDRAVAAAGLSRNGMGQPEPAGEIADPGLRFRVRPDDDGRGIKPVLRSASAMAGIAERLSDSIRERPSLMSGVRCRCASTVTTRSTHPRDQRADDLLADRFALVESRVLAHVAEIGRQQDEALGASAPQRLGGEQQRNEFVVRPVERGIDDGRRPTPVRPSPVFPRRETHGSQSRERECRAAPRAAAASRDDDGRL